MTSLVQESKPVVNAFTVKKKSNFKLNKTLRLFFIIDNDEPHASAGGFYAIFKFAEFLARKGHQVFIYSVHDLKWVKPNSKLKVFYRPHLSRKSKIISKLDRTLSQMCDQWILTTLLRKFKPDWILGVLTYSAIKAEGLGKRFQIPVANFIYECPPWMEQVWGQKFVNATQDPFTQKLWEKTRQAYLGSQVLFPNSGLSQKFNQNWLNGKKVAEPIHPGIDADQMEFKSLAIEPIVLNKEKKQLLFVGRLVKNKNVHDLISALPFLKHSVELHICGTGPELENLKNQASLQRHIHFHGYIHDSILWSLFRQCDIVVYPTAFEGFGMPPMQALYFGKPCLASNLEVFESIFGNTLEYFRFGNIEDLSTQLNALLSNPDYCRNRGEAGRQYVLDNFTWTNAAEKIEQTLMESKHE